MSSSTLASNRKAYYTYHILEKIEAGIVLTGTEVKSCRQRRLSFADAFASLSRQEVWLHNMHINPYENGSYNNHDPKRVRKLLLHKSEIRKLGMFGKDKAMTLIPLSFYLKRGKIKVSLGVCQGKTKYDKREAMKKREADKVMRKATARR